MEIDRMKVIQVTVFLAGLIHGAAALAQARPPLAASPAPNPGSWWVMTFAGAKLHD
jgi:hypothetical protein